MKFSSNHIGRIRRLIYHKCVWWKGRERERGRGWGTGWDVRVPHTDTERRTNTSTVTGREDTHGAVSRLLSYNWWCHHIDRWCHHIDWWCHHNDWWCHHIDKVLWEWGQSLKIHFLWPLFTDFPECTLSRRSVSWSETRHISLDWKTTRWHHWQRDEDQLINSRLNLCIFTRLCRRGNAAVDLLSSTGGWTSCRKNRPKLLIKAKWFHPLKK